MPRALNIATGQVEELDNKSLASGIQAGAYDFVPDETYALKDEGGKVRGISGSGARLALDRQGFRFEGAQEKQGRLVDEMYAEEAGGLGGTIAALGKGVAKGLTLGLSDAGLRALDFDAEALRALEDEHGIAHGIGDIVGTVAPALMTGGTSLLAKSPAALVGRLGEKVAERGIGKSMLSEVIHKGAGYAAEGALFSAGEYISDGALERKELSAEGFVGAMGEGALWGGAFGGGSAVLGRAASAAGKAAKGLAKKAEGLTSKVEELKTKSIKRLLPKKEQTAKALRRKESTLKREADRVRLEDDALESIAGRSVKAAGDDETIAAYRRFKAAKAKAGDIAETALKEGESRVKSLEEAAAGEGGFLREMFQKPHPVKAAAAETGDDIVKSVFDIGEYEAARHELAEQLKKVADPEDLAKLDDITAGYKEIAAKSAERVEKSGPLKGVMGGLEAWEAAELLGVPVPQVEDLPVAGPVLGAFLKYRLAKKVIGGGKVATVIDTPLAQVAEKSASVQDRISDAISKFATAGKKAGAKAIDAGPKVATPLASKVLASKLFEAGEHDDAPKQKKGQQSSAAAAFQQRMHELNAAVANIGRVEQMVRERFPIGDPQIQQQVIRTTQKKLEFLHGKAPKDPRPPNPMGLKERPWHPGPAALEEFSRYVRAAENPASVLEDMASGKLTYEAAETLRKVYPAMFAAVQEELLDNLAEHREQPYSKRVQLSVLFDVPVEETMAPEYLKATKDHYDELAQSAGQPQQPTVNADAATQLGELAMSSTMRRGAR